MPKINKAMLIMKKIILLFCAGLFLFKSHAQNNPDNRTRLFDDNWRFIKDSSISAEAQNYDDSKWRTVTLPHDWSIEDLLNQNKDTVTGPFDKNSIGQSATGFTDGGTGWYRKKFI